MKSILGYGRYNDDVQHVGCPRARTSETPCIARDGHLALDDSGECVGCGQKAPQLLLELVEASGRAVGDRTTDADLADQLRDLVREVTEPSTSDTPK